VIRRPAGRCVSFFWSSSRCPLSVSPFLPIGRVTLPFFRSIVFLMRPFPLRADRALLTHVPFLRCSLMPGERSSSRTVPQFFTFGMLLFFSLGGVQSPPIERQGLPSSVLPTFPPFASRRLKRCQLPLFVPFDCLRMMLI